MDPGGRTERTSALGTTEANRYSSWRMLVRDEVLPTRGEIRWHRRCVFRTCPNKCLGQVRFFMIADWNTSEIEQRKG